MNKSTAKELIDKLLQARDTIDQNEKVNLIDEVIEYLEQYI